MIPEKAFLAQVIDLARHLRWRVYHSRPGMMRSGKWSTPMSGDAGWPDLAMCRGKRLIFAELKSANGEPSEDQMIWLALLDHAGAEVYLWRPADIESIERILK